MNKHDLLTINDLIEIFQVSRSTIYRWITDVEDFPKRINIGPNTVRWSAQEVESWKNSFFE